jgi:biotin carboxyl carrier protein
MSPASHQSFQFAIAGVLHRLSMTTESGLYHVQMEGREFNAEVRPISSNCLSLNIAGRFLTVYLAEERGKRYISIDGRQYIVEEAGSAEEGQFSPLTQAAQMGSAIVSPMPGQVVKVQVVEGDTVEKNQTLAIVEAMKMENELKSPSRARVKRICAQAGDLVDAGQPVVELELEE